MSQEVRYSVGVPTLEDFAGASPPVVVDSQSGILYVVKDGDTVVAVAGTGGAGLSDGDYGDIVVSGGGTVISIDSAVMTAAGRALVDDANATAQRATLGLGTAAVAATGDFEAAGAVSTHAALTETHGISAFGASLVDDLTAAAARATLGIGDSVGGGQTVFIDQSEYVEGEIGPPGVTGPSGATGAAGATGVDAPPNTAPGTVFQIFEDFEHLFRTSTDVHKWTSATLGTGSGVSQLQGTGDGIHHGLVKLETGTTTTGNAQLAMQPAPATPYQGAVSLHATDETIMEGLFYLNALPNGTDTYNFRFGLADASTGSTEACRAFISWDGANVVVTISNTIASVTTTDTATITTLVANQWTHIKMVATLSAQSVYIDGVLIVSATRTASSSQMNPHYAIIKTAGTTEVFAVVDLFWLYRLYATPRHANLGYITAVAATDGVDGTDGINGLPGPAIYLAADSGEDGMSLPGLPGPQGPTGATGSQGIQGDPGTPGTPGADGVDGADGAAGPQGPTGPAVFMAADSGEDGISLPGAAGPQGPAGSAGAAGPAGSPGTVMYLEPDPGEEGPRGLQGERGTAGAAGSQGPAGQSGSILFLESEAGDMGMMGPPGPMGTLYTKVATLASDQATAANTTPVTLTGLVFDYEVNSKYRIWAMGRVAPTAATTGCGFQFDLSSAVTAIDVQFFHQLASTGTLSGGHSIADDASVGVSSGMPGTSTYPVTVHGLLVTTTNTGTAQLRFRSETTAVTTCKAGFTLVVEKIA